MSDQKFKTVIDRNTFYFYNPVFQEKYESYINSLSETLLVLKNKIETEGLKKIHFENLLIEKENGLRALLALTGFANESLKRLLTVVKVADNKELSKQLKYHEIRHPHKRARKTNILAKDYGGKKFMLHPFGPLVSDVWTDIHRVKHNKFRDEHPCQLPIHLLERIILMSTNENDIVLDPFNGTGTTAIAAKRLCRQYIGFDLDKQYVQITQNKLEQIKPVSKIDKYWVSFYLDQVVTLRNEDWNDLKDFFYIPNNPEEIDITQILLKKKTSVQTPLKSYLTVNGHNGENNINQITLFEPTVDYKTNSKGMDRKTKKKIQLSAGVAASRKRKTVK